MPWCRFWSRRSESHCVYDAGLDSLMRGVGRMIDHGYQIGWGVGRHGPGDNIFAYFVDPFGFVIEYTAEVLQVDDSYQPRGPGDWKWPPGRMSLSPPCESWKTC